MSNKVYRNEYKYLITTQQQAILKSRIGCLMHKDNNIAPWGGYNIRNLYFDSIDDKCLHEVENGVNNRFKYRLRMYNKDENSLFIEKKQKDNGLGIKFVRKVSREEFEKGLDEVVRNNYYPKVIVEYDRYPYVYSNGNIRVTFDTNISSSKYFNNFFDFTIPKRPVLPLGFSILEVKFDAYIPDFILKALEIENLQRIAFSKYVLCRQYML